MEPTSSIPGPSDRSLLARIQEGSQGAARLMYQRYAQRLLGLIRAKAAHDVQAREDPEDIVQSVFGSFFRKAQHGLYHAPESDELWGLFLVIALNKIRAKSHFHRAAKRDVRRTIHDSHQADDDTAVFDPPDTHGAATAILEIVVHDLLERLPEAHQEVVRLRIEGHEVADIATRTQRSKRTVERILQELRERLATELRIDDATEDRATPPR